MDENDNFLECCRHFHHQLSDLLPLENCSNFSTAYQYMYLPHPIETDQLSANVISIKYYSNERC